MHFLTNKSPIPIGPSMALAPGQWLMEDINVGELVMRAGGGECEITLATDYFPRLSSLDHESAKSILVIRPGRFGDLILLTPCLREIKRRFPQCSVAVATLPMYRDALVGCPYIDGLVSYPVSKSDLDLFDVVESLEILTSMRAEEEATHMTDLFAQRLGLELATKKPDFFLSMKERNWAFEAYPAARTVPNTTKRRCVVQVMSSSPARDYPQKQLAEVLRRLVGRNWDVVLIGTKSQITGATPGITNCAADDLTFRQSAAVLATANVFFGPDSAFIHVAGALGIPAVGVFSVVPWELRTKYCDTTRVIQAKAGCDLAPCFHAPQVANGFPANGPCAKVRRCCALETVDPERVVAQIEKMA